LPKELVDFLLLDMMSPRPPPPDDLGFFSSSSSSSSSSFSPAARHTMSFVLVGDNQASDIETDRQTDRQADRQEVLTPRIA